MINKLIIILILFIFCTPPKFDNACDYKSKTYQAFALIRLSSNDKSAFCLDKGVSSNTSNPIRTPPTVAFKNIVANTTLSSGFILGTAGDAVGLTRVEVSFDGGAYNSATGTTNWKMPIPNGSNTWRHYSKHTISVRSVNSNNQNSTVSTLTVRMGKNRDINGDGFADTIFTTGRPGTTTFGKANLYLTNNAPNSATTAATASTIITGESANDLFGAAVTTCDVNGDGFADTVVTASANVGYVYIFHGAATLPSTISASSANRKITMEDPIVGLNGATGYYIDCGDVNGDRYPDIVVSSIRVNSDSGRVYIFHSSGASGITATTFSGANTTITGSATEFFGYNIVLGDFQNDGFMDLAVSNISINSSTGQIRIFHSTSSAGITATSSISSTSLIAGDGVGAVGGQFGYWLWAGDFNGDGYMDLVSGANIANTVAGRTYLFASSGTASGITTTTATNANITVTGENNNDRLGSSAALMDLNNDGFDEFILGAGYYLNDSQIGRMYIYPGSSSVPLQGTAAFSASTISRRITGTYLGRFSAAIGFADLNGDGYMDLISSANIAVPSGGSSLDGIGFIFYNDKTSNYFTGNLITDANITILPVLNRAERFGYNLPY